MGHLKIPGPPRSDTFVKPMRHLRNPNKSFTHAKNSEEGQNLSGSKFFELQNL